MGADVSELIQYAADIAASIPVVRRDARAVVSRGALNIKRDWRDNARATSGRHAPLYPGSIGYDLETAPDHVEAVIGPDKAKPQGPLGNLLEFGSVNSPPHNDGGRALDAEEPRFIAAVEALAEDTAP